MASTALRPGRRQCVTSAAGRCACEGDPAGWYVKHASSLRGYILAWTHDPDLADDCTSKTYLRAVARGTAFRCTGDGVRPWLFTIARNIVHDHLKSAVVQRETLTDTIIERTDPANSPEQRLLQRELTTVLLDGVRRLPPDQARCVRLRFLAELSVGETAREMGRPEGAIRALQYRALRSLRTHLADVSR